MKRVFNAIIFLVLVGALLFLAWKAKLLPSSLGPSETPATPAVPKLVERASLRVAAADRPERLMLASLQNLLKAKGETLELVDYDQETVWLELAGGEIDLVIAPLGEVVKSQARFRPGQLLFFTGLSEGLDLLLASPDAEKIRRVAVTRDAGVEFLAQQMLPEAQVMPAADLQEVESWLKGKAVEAALVDTSVNSEELEKTFKELTRTSSENPMPSVAVLSRVFVENVDSPEYATRKDVLASALARWAGLVAYLQTQPDLLRSTLQKEAGDSGTDVERLLAAYRFLDPAGGREQLNRFLTEKRFEQVVDLLILAGVPNLTAPDWDKASELPVALSSLFPEAVATTTQPEAPSELPVKPVVTPSPSPSPKLTPLPTPDVTPEPSKSPVERASRIEASHTYLKFDAPSKWPEPEIKKTISSSASLPPALSSKAVAVAAKDYLYMHSFKKKLTKVPVSEEIVSGPVSDGRNFFFATSSKVYAVNLKGKTLWELPVKGQAMLCSSLAEEKLVLAVDEGDRAKVLCLDSSDGEQLWSEVHSQSVTTAPILAGSQLDLVITLGKDGKVMARNLADGQTVWAKTLAEPLFIAPAAGSGKLALASPSGRVLLWNLSDGSEVWEAELGTSLMAPPTVTSTGVLIPAKDTYLYKLSSDRGSIDWKTRLSQSLSEPAIVVGDKIWQSDEGGEVQTLKLQDGSLLDAERFGQAWVSRPSVYENSWSVLNNRGEVRVYRK